MLANPALGQGHLDVLRLEGPRLLLVGGWYLGEERQRVSGVKVLLDGEPLEIVSHLFEGESPDIAKAFPAHPDAGRARFYARVVLPSRALRREAWVQVVPLLGDGGRGFGLHGVLASELARPDAASVASVGGGYEVQALEFLRYFVELCRLPRDGNVLDVGCGIGRMALGLVGYLVGGAQYHGFDVMADAIATARATVGAGRPRFRFEHVDLANLMYHAEGRVRADGFRFPVEDAWADLVILTSVLTHLREAETRQYLREAGRVLASGGRVLATAFLFDAEVEALVAAGRASQPFVPWEGCWTIDFAVPEKAIGYARGDFVRWVGEAGLEIERFHPGSWCGRQGGQSYQDLLILRR